VISKPTDAPAGAATSHAHAAFGAYSAPFPAHACTCAASPAPADADTAAVRRRCLRTKVGAQKIRAGGASSVLLTVAPAGPSRAKGGGRSAELHAFSCCQQRECTVGTWVGATVGRGGGAGQPARSGTQRRGGGAAARRLTRAAAGCSCARRGRRRSSARTTSSVSRCSARPPGARLALLLAAQMQLQARGASRTRLLPSTLDQPETHRGGARGAQGGCKSGVSGVHVDRCADRPASGGVRAADLLQCAKFDPVGPARARLYKSDARLSPRDPLRARRGKDRSQRGARERSRVAPAGLLASRCVALLV